MPILALSVQVYAPQDMTTTTNDGIMARVPAEVKELLEWFRTLLEGHGRVDEHHKTRISVHRKYGRDRYLKYEPDENRWVFCPAIGDRMNILDPKGVCNRKKDGIRSKKAVGEYTKSDLTELRPILEELARMIREDERSCM
jgi:hypothetical protein